LQLKTLGTAERWIAERHQAWDQRLDRLGAYLDATDPTTTSHEQEQP
jgi:hypothetical protein